MDTFTVGGDLEVQRLGFGAMRITGDGVWGPPRDRATAVQVLRRAAELGVDFIDTADSYGPEVSEQLIADALHPYPDDLVIATKGGFDRSGPNQWHVNCRPERVREGLDGSLKRLRLDRIDLFQLHRIDDKVPEEDQFEALAEFQREGKIRHIGLSEVSVDQIERARLHVPVVSVQNRYNVADRTSDPVVDYCYSEGIAFLPWHPLGGPAALQDDGTLARIAGKHGGTASQIALAWLLARSPVMLAIPGTSTVAHLEENVAAAAIRLDEQDMRDLGRISTPG